MKMGPEKIVYISCNPETLARDLKYLTKKGYQVKKIQPVEMFAFTEHVETSYSYRDSKKIDEKKQNKRSAFLFLVKCQHLTIC